MEREGSLSTSVVSAIAEVKDVDVTSLGFVLNDYIDTDALDSLFEPTLDGSLREDSRLELALPEHSVTIYSDGHIVVTDGQESATPEGR